MVLLSSTSIIISSLLYLQLATGTITEGINYGVDCSFPIHHHFLTESANLETTKTVFGNERMKVYSEFFSGCLKAYGQMDKAHLCHEHERNRMEMNRMQPSKMTNHTVEGFKKTKVSAHVWEMIQRYWNERVNRVVGDIPWGLHNESWPEGNTFTNHWSSPTKILSIRANETVTEAIWEEVSSHLQAWIPQASSFTRSSLYGIRVYTSGSILAPHVDRDPLISSAIINVDQRVTEPWPLEVYDHGGRAHNLTLEPGEIILYESHSILHGRPFTLQGDYYANIFIHFKPEFTHFEPELEDEEMIDREL